MNQTRTEIGSPSQMLNDARALRKSHRLEEFVPGNARPFFANGSFPAPAYGAANQIELCQYQVPIGWEGWLTAIMLYSTGDGNWIQGSGDLVFTVDIDFPLGGILGTGRAVPGYAAIARNLGDSSEPWPVANRGWNVKSGETYRVKARTVQNVQVGTPHYLHGSIQGIVWPNC